MALTPGRLTKTNGAPSGGQQPLQDALPVGWADFEDAATAGTPISVTGGGGAVTLTNNKAGANTQTAYLPDGVTTALWNASTNAFSFAELAVGDMVEVRLDITVTTTAANQEVFLQLDMSQGGSSPFSLMLGTDKQFKSAGAHRTVEAFWFYIGSGDVKNNPAQFKISSPDNCTVVVAGWACKVTRRG
jgi:hypothetical protein